MSVKNHIYFRHAAHYFLLLDQANDDYIDNKTDQTAALASFDQNKSNINSAFNWLGTFAVSDNQETQINKFALELLNAYPDGGAYLISLRLSSHERIDWLEKALLASRKLGNKTTTQAHLGNLGLAFLELGDITKAKEFFQEATKICEDIGNRKHEGIWTGNLGNIQAKLGNHDLAIKLHNHHLICAQETNDLRGLANAFGNLGVSYAAVGEIEQALSQYEKQFEITNQIGDLRGKAYALLNIGITHHELKNYSKAKTFFQNSLSDMQSIKDHQGESLVLSCLADLSIEINDAQAAFDYIENAIQIAQKTLDKLNLVQFLTIKLITIEKWGNITDALVIGQQAIALANDLDLKNDTAFIEWMLGSMYEKINNYPQAIKFYQDSIKHTNNLENVSKAKQKISKLRHHLNQSDK